MTDQGWWRQEGEKRELPPSAARFVIQPAASRGNRCEADHMLTGKTLSPTTRSEEANKKGRLALSIISRTYALRMVIVLSLRLVWPPPFNSRSPRKMYPPDTRYRIQDYGPSLPRVPESMYLVTAPRSRCTRYLAISATTAVFGSSFASRATIGHHQRHCKSLYRAAMSP